MAKPLQVWTCKTWNPAMLYCCIEFKVRYLKNLKLFSIRVKELFDPLVLRRKGDGCLLLFWNIYLRNRSLSNARWFCAKNLKLGRWISNQLKVDLTETKFAVRENNNSYISNMCAQKESQIWTWIKQLWAKYRFFKKLPQFHIFTEIVLFEVKLDFFRLNASSL